MHPTSSCSVTFSGSSKPQRTCLLGRYKTGNMERWNSVSRTATIFKRQNDKLKGSRKGCINKSQSREREHKGNCYQEWNRLVGALIIYDVLLPAWELIDPQLKLNLRSWAPVLRGSFLILFPSRRERREEARSSVEDRNEVETELLKFGAADESMLASPIYKLTPPEGRSHKS